MPAAAPIAQQVCGGERSMGEYAVCDDGQIPGRFIDGLRELQMRRTDSGAGLHQFLKLNLPQFDNEVAEEILSLARQVTSTEVMDG